MGKLERSRQARVGSWTEKQLHLALSSRGQRSQEELLRPACMGAGEMDKVLPILEAAELLGFDQEELLEAAERGQLASMVKEGELCTSEARLGAWMIASRKMPSGCADAALRMLYLCGFSAGRRSGPR